MVFELTSQKPKSPAITTGLVVNLIISVRLFIMTKFSSLRGPDVIIYGRKLYFNGPIPTATFWLFSSFLHDSTINLFAILQSFSYSCNFNVKFRDSELVINNTCNAIHNTARACHIQGVQRWVCVQFLMLFTKLRSQRFALLRGKHKNKCMILFTLPSPARRPPPH